MIVVDSSAWIDYFNGRRTRKTDLLHTFLGREPLVVGDLVPADPMVRHLGLRTVE